MHISDVLSSKGDAVATIAPGETVRTLVESLGRHNVGALVVTSDGAEVLGIVSERDVVRLLARDPAPMDHTVESIMTTEVQTCGRDTTVDELMAIMTEHRIRHVPVVTDGRLAGIVSIGDVVKTRIGELEFEREQLSSYIARST